MRGTARRAGNRSLPILAAAVVSSVCVLVPGVDGNRGSLGAQENRPDQAAELLRRAGIRRGVCALLGSDGDLAIELARASELLIHVREPRADVAADLRGRADDAGFDIRRVAVESGPLSRLPYAENLIDLVIATRATADALGDLSLEEVLRVLRPEGRAIIGAASREGGADNSLKNLRGWARTGTAEGIRGVQDSSGVWVEFRKPPLAGADDWSHWEHGPDNNPVSTDQIIKAPYMTQFLAHPLYIGMPSVTTAAGGRTFLAIGHIAHHRREWDSLQKLIGRNGYNGTVLWERKLPEGYLVHRSAFIATRDTFYMILGNRCMLLDPATGEEKGQIVIPGVQGEWKWMALKDGILYVLAGRKGPGVEITQGDRSFGGWSWADLSRGYYSKPRIPFGFGDTLAAYHLEQKEVLWKHEEEEKRPIDSRCMALGENRIYLYCPGKHLRSLNSTTGKVIWTNADAEILNLIEEPGRGLTSTPGFRTACMAVLTKESLIIQGQTRMNVIALSTADGYLLWKKKKITNNPNAIYVDGKVVLGVGPRGSHVVVDPVSGEVLEDLRFLKRACTRLTACPDSFFVRGEGTLRFDRATKKVLVDGSIRPACNDGALPANGLLYLGPWQCDCNLSLIGHMARCSAGDFEFARRATEGERLERGEGDIEKVAPFEITDRDWPTYRGNNHRTGSTAVRVPGAVRRRWEYSPGRATVPTAPTAAGGLVFVAGEDGKVRAIDAATGSLRWEFATPSPIKHPPAIWEGRAYFGSGDGHAYAVEAATGRLLWRFRAAPVERHVMVYGVLGSTWPVNSGVLVRDGTAYFAAGIIDHDGTHVYAVDARSGKIKWQNNTSGHLAADLHKGVSVQGNLTVRGRALLLAGGNQVCPAPFDLETGECLANPFEQGQPKANGGRFIGVFQDRTIIAGGRILYSAPENVATKGSFEAFSGRARYQFNFGGIPPAWDGKTLALVNFKHGELTCCEVEKVSERIAKGYPRGEGRDRFRRINLAATLEADGAVRWQSDLGESEKFEAVSLAVASNAIVAVVQYQQKFRSQPQWFVVAFDAANGRPYYRHELPFAPLPGGLLIDREGQVIVTLLDGRVVCLARGNRPQRGGGIRD